MVNEECVLNPPLERLHSNGETIVRKMKELSVKRSVKNYSNVLFLSYCHILSSRLTKFRYIIQY